MILNIIVVYILSLLVSNTASITASKTLIPHPKFRAGIFSYVPSTATSTFTSTIVTITYSSAMSNINNVIQPTLGICAVDINIQSNNLKFNVSVSTFRTNSFDMNVTVVKADLTKLSISYLSCQLTLNYITVFYFQWIGPWNGALNPSNTYNLGTSYSSNTKLLIFMFSLILNTTTPNSFQLIQNCSFTSPATLIIGVNIPAGITIDHTHSTIFIVDKTAFQNDLPVNSIIQTGLITSTTNYLQITSITDQFKESFVVGLQTFKFVNSKMVIQSTFDSTKFSMSSQNFNNINFVYFFVKYYACPLTIPYFKQTDTLCYDDCGIRYFNKVSTQTCQLCLYQCGDCTNASTCTSCQSSDNRQLNTAGNDCVPIPGYFDNGTTVAQPCQSPCFTCEKTNFTCLSCVNNSYYYISSNNTCNFCNVSVQFCLTCENNQSCLTCQTGYTLDNINNLCTLSCQSPCLTCQTQATRCLSCLDNTYSYDSITKTCALCSTIINFCQSCDNNAKCLTCKNSTFYLDSANNICYLCSDVISSCQTCDSAGTCLTCFTGYTFDNKNNQCNKDLPPCSLTLASNGCLQCKPTNQNQCTICDQSIGYYLDTNTLKCNPKCGDSKFLTGVQQCQDGNIDNMDGCSQICKIQSGFDCQISVTTKLSECIYTLPINFTIDQLFKDPNDNQVIAYMTLQPPLKAFQNYDFSTMITTDLPITEYIFNYDKTTGVLQMIMKYNQSIDGRVFQVTVDPPKIGVFLGTTASHLQVAMKTTDGIPLNYYQNTYYSTSQILFYMSTIVAVLGWICLFIGIYSGKLIGLETLGVIQLTFLAIFSFPTALSPGFESLCGLAYSNGINIFFFINSPTHSTHSLQYNVNILPITYRQLYMKVPFLQNYNLDIFLFTIPLIVALIIHIVNKIKKSQELLTKNEQKKSFFSKFLYQLTTTGLIASLYITFASLGIQFRFGLLNMQSVIDYVSIVIGIFLIIPYIIYFVLLIKKNQLFGQFNNFFSIYVNYSSNFYNYVIIERVIISLSLALAASPFVLTVPIIITIIHFLIVFIKRPYLQKKQNYRVLANMVFQFIILLSIMAFSVISYQNQQDLNNSPMYTNPIILYFPIIILIMLLVVVIYNFVFLFIHILTSQKLIQEKKNLEIQIADLSKLRMQAYQMNQFLPSPFILLKDQLNKKKGIKQLNIESDQKQRELTILGQISPMSDYKGSLLNKAMMNQMLVQRTKDYMKNSDEKIFQNTIYNDSKNKNLIKQLRKQAAQNPITDEVINQLWDQINQFDVSISQQQQKEGSSKSLLQQQYKKENSKNKVKPVLQISIQQAPIINILDYEQI